MTEVDIVTASGTVELIEVGGSLTGGDLVDVNQGSVDIVALDAGHVQVELVTTGTGVAGVNEPSEVDVPVQTQPIITLGQQGPPGPPGKPGEFATFVHTQLTPSTEWRVEHPFAGRPSVTLVDTAGSVFFGDVTYVDDHLIVVTLSAALGGYAYLS